MHQGAHPWFQTPQLKPFLCLIICHHQEKQIQQLKMRRAPSKASNTLGAHLCLLGLLQGSETQTHLQPGQAEPLPHLILMDSCPKPSSRKAGVFPAEPPSPNASRAWPGSIPQVKNTPEPSKMDTKSREGKKTGQERTFQQAAVDFALAFRLLCITDVSIVREARNQTSSLSQRQLKAPAPTTSTSNSSALS